MALWIQLLITVSIFGAPLVDGTDPSDPSDPACIIDPSLDALAPNNYLDCQTEEMKQAKTTSCCTINMVKSCCNQGERWDQMIIIGCVVGVTSLLLFVLLFIMWYKRDAMPCLGSCMTYTQKLYYEVEESFCCCEARVQKRRREQQMKRKCQKQPALLKSGDMTDDKGAEGKPHQKLIQA